MTAQRNANRLAVTSSLAIATALLFGGAQAAKAQSFNASGTVVAGSASISTGSGTTDVFVGGTAVINWAPTDTGGGTAPIFFQNSGTTATFSSTTDFTVLNRILPATPTRAIQFDGTVLSRIGASAPTPGGTIYFYSPGGIILSPTAVFDVGNLGLTTSPVAYDAATGVFDGADTVTFGTANAGSSVTLANSHITANGYVAIVSPFVFNSTTSSIDLTAPSGSGAAAALVAADAATITFSPDGLFDIAVTQGSSSTGTVLVGGGNVGGATAGASPGGNHRVYMVAIPQNQAITMSISGSAQLGFDIAAAADVQGNAVVLSAGYDIVGGQVSQVRSAGSGTGSAEIDMQGGGGSVTSAFEAHATGGLNVNANSGTISFASDVNLFSGQSATLQADGASGFANIAGNLSVDATNRGSVGGTASMIASNGGRISVGGDVLVIATGYGLDSVNAGISAGAGIGGTGTIRVNNNSRIDVTGLTLLFADGVGGNAMVAGAGGGDGFGGTVNLIVDTSSIMAMGRSLDFTAEGFGGDGNGCVTCLRDGGNATGGTANLVVNGGTITTTSYFRNSVRAIAGSGAAAAAGSANGGTFNATLTGATVSSDGQFLVDANGAAGDHTAGGSGGNGVGGAINWNGGSLTAPQAAFNAIGSGGNSLSTGGTGGAGSGGGINVSFASATLGTLDVNSGGFAGEGDVSGGIGSGGSSVVTATGAVDVSGPISIYSHGAGGNTSTGTVGAGRAFGGIARLISTGSGDLTALAPVIVDASAFGGNNLNGDIAGRAGGGTAEIRADNGGVMSFADTVDVRSQGIGGNSESTATTGAGGLGSGGSADLRAIGGSISLSNQTVLIDASGFGGNGTQGGRGLGGGAQLSVSDGGATGQITSDNTIQLVADGFGGSAGRLLFSNGGSGEGGNATAIAFDGGSISVVTGMDASANGAGGAGVGNNSAGGSGFGGNARFAANNVGSIAVQIQGLSAEAAALGGSSTDLGGTAGNATGGVAVIDVNLNSTLSTGSDTILDASAAGGFGLAAGGFGDGGIATTSVGNGSTLSVGGSAFVIAAGSGGSGEAGADGIGGDANFLVSDSTANVAFRIVGIANATGGDYDTDTGTGVGGNATGGSVVVASNISVTGPASLTVGTSIETDSSGLGGNGESGGIGTGGDTFIGADGGSLAVADVFALADGRGGAALADGGVGGAGEGGAITLQAERGGNVTVTDTAGLFAIGAGGNGTALNTVGGDATGGSAIIFANTSGNIQIQGAATLEGRASGGNSSSVSGNGGSATGGLASISLLGGADIAIGGDTSLDAGAHGGDGDLNNGTGIGGAGTGGIARIAVGVDHTNDAGGGSVTLGSFVQVNAKGVGGDAGQSGDGTGGTAVVLAWNGSLSTNTTSNLVINADGDGGFGNAGGDGGNGTGGIVNLFAGNSLNGGSTISVDHVTATATGNGGFGNRGLNPGDTGGNGGNGTGGTAVVTAAAGNGHLTASTVDIQVGGFGGGAGDGGNSGSGPGGIGGIGGNGSGGFINVGTESATATPGAAGTADFGSINASAQGVGGAGGAGGSGTTQGNGGSGGDGTSGASVLLVRGSTVTITGTTNLFAGATGGNGGTGATDGIGGDATTGGNGGVGIIASNRFQVPSQRGTLVAGDIFASVPVQAGSGSVRGTATVSSEPLSISLTNADATVGQLQFFAFDPNAIANGPPLVAGTPSTFLVTNGTLTANGRVDFATDGDITLSIDNGTVNVPRIDISGRNWIAGPTPVTVGTLNSASTIDFTSAGDLVANVTISAATDLFFSAAGDVLFADIDAGGNLLIQNGGSTTLGNLSVIGNVDLLAAGSITTLGVDAGGYLNYESTGSVTTGALAAGQYIEIDSLGGGANVGNVDAGDYFTLQANGPVGVGNITAGIVNPSTDPLATYRVGVAGVGNVAVGTVNAAGDVGLLAQTGSVTSGALTGRDMLLFADTGVTVGGALNANGRVGIAKSAVAALGGAFDTFDKEPVFSALPFQVDLNSAATFGLGGPIAINGAVQTQSFRAYTTGDLTTSGPITATNGPLSMAAGGNIAVAGNLTGPFVVGIANGTLTVGDVTAPSLVGLFGLSGTTTGAISSGGAVLITSSGDVSTGTIASDPALFGLPANSNSKVQIFGRNIATGGVTSSQGISLVANQGLVTGPLQSQTDTLLLAGTGVTVNGSLNARSIGIANVSQASLGGPIATFDPSLVLAALPSSVTLPVSTSLAVAGPVTISGPVQGTTFRSFSTGAFNVAGNLTSGNNGIIVGADGGITVSGNISSGSGTVLVSQGAASVGNVTSPFTVIVIGQQSVTTGNLSSAGNVQVFSAGNATTGNLVSSAVPGLAGNVTVSVGGSATVANVSSGRTASIAAGQNITVGQVNAATDVLLLPGQSLTAGSIRAGITASSPATGLPTAATGRILIANNSQFQAGGSPTNPDYNAIFAATPVAASGSVQINGSVYSGLFEAYNLGDFAANDITAFTRFHVESGGTATVRRRWFSPILDLWSGDIAIQAAPVTNPNVAVGLNAGTTGEITLYATNANGAFIGDGLTGNGYALSQAEFSLINSGTVFVTAKDQSANLIDMTVGNLTMTGPQSGSTIDDPNGQVVFATGTLSSGPNGGGTPSGGLRVSGNLTGTGFLSTNEVSFLADLFELDAGTGSVKITDANGGLSGLISIEATHIHMAESSILTKLEDDPLYVGHIADLNRPTSVSRPDGIFNALALDIFPGSTFYIQNTGTAATPAGFLSGPDTDVTPPTSPPTGGIEVVVNGQFVTDTGTLTGKAAYDALLAAQPDFTGFSTNSQLNACLFIGGCQVEEDPVGGISSEIEMISDNDISDSPVVEDEPDEANSEEQSEEEKAAEEEVDGSPIAPPAPLIDTRPLNPPATITEPVAGSGNPALIGSVVNEGTAQEDQQ